MWKRGEIAPKEQFLLFSTIFFNMSLISGVKLLIHLLNVVVRFIVFLTSATLVFRGTDISKCFSPVEFEITRVDCSIYSLVCLKTSNSLSLFHRKMNANYAEIYRVGNLEASFQYVPLVHFF